VQSGTFVAAVRRNIHDVHRKVDNHLLDCTIPATDREGP
jgi:hypothetical protein